MATDNPPATPAPEGAIMSSGDQPRKEELGLVHEIEKKLAPTATGTGKINPDRFEWDAREACESLEKIREMLLIGLASYGEIERLENAQVIEKRCGNEIAELLQVIHPTGDAATVSDFAEALRNVDIVMRKIRGWTEEVQSRAPEEPEGMAPKEVQS